MEPDQKKSKSALRDFGPRGAIAVKFAEHEITVHAKCTLRTGLLLGVGNPLLDISATVGSDFLEKYELKADNAILAGEKHLPLYKELVDKYTIEYIAGGATQNSMRVFQWIVQTPNVSSYFGCVGKDKYADILDNIARKAGVNVQYQIDESTETGLCAALLSGKSRSLVANLSAANNFKKNHLDVPENKKIVDDADFIYVGGFFLSVSPESIMILAKHAAENNKHFMMNLSAPFLCQLFKEPMMQAMPYIDVLFGNETEALTFSKEQNFNTEDIIEIALKISQLEKVNKSRQRMVIITQGCSETIVVKDGEVLKFPVVPIEQEKIVDTNGAGDAFVGGFLSQLVQEGTLENCTKAGHYAANYIIQQSGVTMDDKPDLQL